MRKQVPPVDPNYRVEGLPPSVRGKVTQFAEAAMDYAMIGAAHPLDMGGIEEQYHNCRYELERTIKTLLDREARKPRRKK